MKLNNLIGNNEKEELLFSDFFDTIVHRSVPPEHVKKLWAGRLESELGIQERGLLYDMRFNIEAQLCQESLQKDNELEFRYDDMIKKLYALIDGISMTFPEFREVSIKIELDLEREVQFLNYKSLEYIKSKRQNGVKVYVVSDFYFSKEMFQSLLEYHQIESLFDDVFISAELMASKRSGRMYDKLKTPLRLSDLSLVTMYGDNKHSDYVNAKEKGLNAILLSSQDAHAYYKNFFNYRTFTSMAKSFDNMYLHRADVDYRALGLSLYLFIQKLHARLVKNGVNTVFFMAREGWFLKRLFDDYCLMIGNKITSHYFYVSRRATFLPSLKSLPKEDFSRLFRQYIDISPKEFMLNLNFSEKQMSCIATELECDVEEKIQGFNSSEVYFKLRDLDQFKEFYEVNRLTQRDAIQQYWKSFNYDGSNVYIVDVGWKGSIQDNLVEIFDEHVFTGFYLGLNFLSCVSESNHKYGILFDQLNNNVACRGFYDECTSIYEVILAAPHGSTQYYTKLGEPEISENSYENALYEKQLKRYQQQIYSYVKCFATIAVNSGFARGEIENYIDREYRAFILSPDKHHLYIYDELSHVESFGVHQVTQFKTESNSKWKNVKIFICSPRNYLSVFWPAHKLITSGLSWLVPIYKAYRIVKGKR